MQIINDVGIEAVKFFAFALKLCQEFSGETYDSGIRCIIIHVQRHCYSHIISANIAERNKVPWNSFMTHTQARNHYFPTYIHKTCTITKNVWAVFCAHHSSE